MKTEQAPTGPAFNSIRGGGSEPEAAHGKGRFGSAARNGRHSHRASFPRHSGSHPGGLLRNSNPPEPGSPNLHVPEPALITIQPWDVSQIGPIEKAIRVSDLGLNPSNDGKLIRLPIPPLTEERRKELVKKLHGAAEHHRVSLRNIRRDANEAIKKLLKDKKVTEDDEKKALEEIQKTTDGYMVKIDQAAKTKEKEIMEIR